MFSENINLYFLSDIFENPKTDNFIDMQKWDADKPIEIVAGWTSCFIGRFYKSENVLYEMKITFVFKNDTEHILGKLRFDFNG